MRHIPIIVIEIICGRLTHIHLITISISLIPIVVALPIKPSILQRKSEGVGNVVFCIHFSFVFGVKSGS